MPFLSLQLVWGLGSSRKTLSTIVLLNISTDDSEENDQKPLQKISSLLNFMYLLIVVKGSIKRLLFLVYFWTLMRDLTLNWNSDGKNSEKGRSQAAGSYTAGRAWRRENGIEITIDNPTWSKEQEGQAGGTNDLPLLHQKNKSLVIFHCLEFGLLHAFWPQGKQGEQVFSFLCCLMEARYNLMNNLKRRWQVDMI